MKKETKKLIILICLMVGLFVLDIVTKWAVVKSFGNPISKTYSTDGYAIIPNLLYIGRTYNDGAAFSMFGSDSGKVVLAILSGVMSCVFIYIFVRYYKKLKLLFQIALALMIAGTFGNFIDRAFYWQSTVGFTGVVDWIYFHFWGHPFAMFNVADSCLVIGCIILFIQYLIDWIKEERETNKKLDKKIAEKEKENEANQRN